MSKISFTIKTITLLFCLFCTFSALGQEVKGRVIDGSDSKPLPAVTIKILNFDSVMYSGTTTNAKGEFKVKTPAEPFYLVTSYIGYRENKIMVDNKEANGIKNLGDIIMNETAQSIDEVVVTASPIIEELNKIIAFPTGNQLKASVSGIDLLQNLRLPGLFVDPIQQKVEIQGTTGVIYRINGANATLQQVVALKADMIERVEYAQTPTIRELNTNSGVINFILKKERTGTFLYAEGLGAVTTGFINGNASAKTIINKSELALNYVVNWRNYSKRYLTENETYYYPDDTYKLDLQGKYAPFGYLSQNINLSYTYNDVKDFLSIQFRNTLYSSHDRNYIDVFQDKPVEQQSFRDIASTFDNYTPALDIYYIRRIDDQQGIEANVVGTLMNTDYKRNFIEKYSNDELIINNITDGKKKSIIFEGLYYNRKKSINYSAGINGSYSDLKNKYEVETDRIKRLELYPYVSIDGKLSEIAYSVGTGVEMIYTKDTEKESNYYRNLTTLSLFYNKNNKWNVRYTFRYTPLYPSLSDLTDVDQRQNPYVIVRGNPLLKPSQTINNRFVFTYSPDKTVRVTTTLKAVKTFDPIRDFFFYDDKELSFVSGIENQNYDRVLGADMNIYLNSLFNRLSISLGGDWNNYKTKGKGYLYHYNNLSWYIYAALQLNDFTINLGYRKPSKQLYGEMIVLNENYSSIGATYNKKAFSIKAGVYYPFSSGTKYATERLSKLAPSVRNVYIKDNANMVYIGFSYNISWGKSLFNVSKRLQNSDWDKGIMKINDN